MEVKSMADRRVYTVDCSGEAAHVRVVGHQVLIGGGAVQSLANVSHNTQPAVACILLGCHVLC